MNMFDISYEAEIDILTIKINKFFAINSMYFGGDIRSLAKYIIDCGFRWVWELSRKDLKHFKKLYKKCFGAKK